MSTELRDAFIAEIVDAVRYCESLTAKRLSDGSPPQEAVSEALNVLAHSFLVILDGGTKLSDEGQQVWLTDSEGVVVAESIHEWLPDTRIEE